MLKTLLILGGALVVSATGLQAQGSHVYAGHGYAAAARPSSYRGYANHYGGYSHGNRGRYFYLGGIPYFYPFGFGYGFGDPYYYGGYYGAYGDGYGYGGGYPYDNGVFNGSVVPGNGPGNGQPPEGASLPEAVQRQLAKRGYYKGSVDGQFGPESRSALSRFQKKQGLKETGRIDEPTLEALGFTDHR